MYIAKKRIKIGDDYREPGQPVPEAAEWRNKDVLLRNGYIEVIFPTSDHEETKAPAKKSGEKL